MIRKIGFLVLLIVLLAIVSDCSPSVDKRLVGSWINVDYGDILVLTDDGQMGIGYFVGMEDVVFLFSYTASNGRGEFWLVNNPEKKASFNYSISGDTLQFDVVGGNPELGGDSGIFKRIELTSGS